MTRLPYERPALRELRCDYIEADAAHKPCPASPFARVTVRETSGRHFTSTICRDHLDRAVRQLRDAGCSVDVDVIAPS